MKSIVTEILPPRVSYIGAFAVGRVVLAAGLLFVVQPLNASAETASDFLKSIEGDFSGRGKAKLIGKQLDTIACKISNSYAADKLVVTGNCASTKGKGKVNGEIRLGDGKLSGTFVSPRPNVEITQSSGVFNDGRLILSASMMDNQVGRLSRVRQIISRSEEGIEAEFFLYDNASKSYKPSGSMKLKKKKAQ